MEQFIITHRSYQVEVTIQNEVKFRIVNYPHGFNCGKLKCHPNIFIIISQIREEVNKILNKKYKLWTKDFTSDKSFPLKKALELLKNWEKQYPEIQLLEENN